MRHRDASLAFSFFGGSAGRPTGRLSHAHFFDLQGWLTATRQRSALFS
jgi:hypothetical protein